MVEAAPSAAFVVAQSNFLLQFEVVTLDPPAELGMIDHAFEADIDGHRGEPVVIRFGSAVWPLDQQPLHLGGFAPAGVVVRRADPPPGKPRSQRRIAAVSPGDRLPGLGGKLQSQRLGRNRLMRLVAAQPRGGAASARTGRRRQWCLAGPPDLRGGRNAGHID